MDAHLTAKGNHLKSIKMLKYANNPAAIERISCIRIVYRVIVKEMINAMNCQIRRFFKNNAKEFIRIANGAALHSSKVCKLSCGA